ncbi:Protein OS-9 [Cocos nucifera]|uniref:Protein OS-9 n=1 Tax=Cocos nucifera TaxID=13894 RepID=A0A8K0IPI2_COCNU|nr:Protein OS-9 [Cocos nucifera]
MMDRLYGLGVTFGRSSREPKYKIEFHSTESPFHPENDLESVMMSDKEGQSYMCFLPLVEESKTVRSISLQNSSNSLLESDRRIKLKTPDELIDVIKDKCFYRYEGWWSYEFCYQKRLRQLHLEDDKIVQEFVLGVFDPEVTAAFNQNHSDVSMVRFVCSEPMVIISSIKEISTCKYVVTLQCPMLCKHPMFQQERPTSHTIHCNEMPRDIKDSSVEDSLKGTHIITIITDDNERGAT